MATLLSLAFKTLLQSGPASALTFVFHFTLMLVILHLHIVYHIVIEQEVFEHFLCIRQLGKKTSIVLPLSKLTACKTCKWAWPLLFWVFADAQLPPQYFNSLKYYLPSFLSVKFYPSPSSIPSHPILTILIIFFLFLSKLKKHCQGFSALSLCWSVQPTVGAQKCLVNELMLLTSSLLDLQFIIIFIELII